MAYKRVNDASLTQVADAIRQKGGLSGSLAFPDDFVSAIGSLETGGGGGIDTHDATASEGDIAKGETAYVKGRRVTGSVPVVENGETQAAVFDVIEKDSTNEGYRVAAHLSKDVLVRNGAVVDTVIPKTRFGEATPDQVLVGTTFTSKEGINLPGAYNPTTVNLQTKRVKPETTFQQVTYDAADGYTGLARVEIEAIQTQTKEIWRNGTYTPDTGKFFDSVTVNILSDAKLGDATSYTFGQISITQTSATASYSCAESIHVEEGEVVLDNATSQTFTMKSGDTSGSCFNGLRGLYFQKSGTTYYVPPDCSIVRSAVKGAGNTTTGYAYKGSIYPVVVDAGTVMGTKTITENGTYYASDDGFDGFESVNVSVSGEELPTHSGYFSDTSPDNGAVTVDYDSGYIDISKQLNDRYIVSGFVGVVAPASEFGDCEQADVLAGKTFTSEKGLKRPGTMTDNGTVTQVLDSNTTSYTIPAGKHSGSGTVSIDTETVTVTPSKIPLTVKANTGKVISSFTMNAIPDKYIEPSGTLNVTGNGTHDVTQYASVNVNVPASGVELPTLTKPAGTSEDLVAGKQLIGPDGSIIEGSVPVRDSVTITLDGINTTSSVNSAGYYGSVSAVFDSSAIEALLDAL